MDTTQKTRKGNACNYKNTRGNYQLVCTNAAVAPKNGTKERSETRYSNCGFYKKQLDYFAIGRNNRISIANIKNNKIQNARQCNQNRMWIITLQIKLKNRLNKCAISKTNKTKFDMELLSHGYEMETKEILDYLKP